MNKKFHKIAEIVMTHDGTGKVTSPQHCHTANFQRYAKALTEFCRMAQTVKRMCSGLIVMLTTR